MLSLARIAHAFSSNSRGWELGGTHRLAIPDLIISVAARSAELVVLHSNADLEQVGAVGGAEQKWVAPRSSPVGRR